MFTPVELSQAPWIRSRELGFCYVNGKPLVVVMISCQQRHEARAVTIPQLNYYHLDPVVFLSPCKPAGSCGNAVVSRSAILYARKYNAPVLFFEDDVDLHRSFTAFLEESMEQDVLTYFYTHDDEEYVRLRHRKELADRVLDPKGVIEPGLYKARHGSKLLGSQAVYLPAGLVKRLRVDIAVDIGPSRGIYGCWSFDVLLDNTAISEGFWPYIALPNPVQHRHVRVARDTQESISLKRSLTFDRL